MKILMVDPGKEPYVKEIDGSLNSMQEAVGGYIEVAYFGEEDVVFVVNDEGKINGSIPNRIIHDKNGETIDIVYGSFFICEEGEEEFKSISDENAQKYTERFSLVKKKSAAAPEREQEEEYER